jgi:hypothetical protein
MPKSDPGTTVPGFDTALPIRPARLIFHRESLPNSTPFFKNAFSLVYNFMILTGFVSAFTPAKQGWLLVF